MNFRLKFFLGLLLSACFGANAHAQVLAVSISSPSNEASGVALTPLPINATVVGTAATYNTQIFVNGLAVSTQIVHSPIAPTVQAVWTPPQPGVYFITAKTTDDIGNSALSLAVRYFATGTIVTSPVDGALVPDGSSVVLKADATPAAGFVKKIDFYVNNVKIGTDLNAPYSLIYTPSDTPVTARAVAKFGGPTAAATATLSPGQVTQIVVSTSGAGYQTVPTVTISGPQTAGTTATAVALLSNGAVSGFTITNPGSGYTSAPTVSITGGGPGGPSSSASATAAITGPIATIAVTSGGSGYSAPPTVTIQGGTGATATATLVGGVVTGITVNTAGSGYPVNPIVSISAPTGISGGSVTNNIVLTTAGTGYTSTPAVTLVGGGGSGATAVATMAGGAITGISVTSGGSGYTSNPSIVVSPALAVTAIATDNNGLPVQVSNPLILNVVKAITPRPTSVISSPAHNTSIAIPTDPNANIRIAVDASSGSGSIAKVELYIDGVLFGTKTGYPYTFDWHPTIIGPYDLVALTYDDKNNVVASTTSTLATLTPAPTHVIIASPPTVTLTSPVDGASLSSTAPTQFSADASDSNTGGSVTSVEFLQDNVVVAQGVSNGSGTYTASAVLVEKKDSSGVSLPSTITARAVNSNGISKVSSSVSVAISSGSTGGGGVVIGIAPTVSVTAPAAGANLPVNNAATLTASASDSDGNISSVQFFVNRQALGGTITAYPYTATWTPTSLGSFSITATTVDNDGNSVTSAPVVVSVSSGSAPSVSMTTPSAGTSVALGSGIPISTSASDTDGTVTQVKIYANGILIPGGTLVSAPYNVNWVPTAAGSYTLTAIATDNTGNTTSTAPVTVTVTSSSAPSVTITSPGPSSNYGVGTPIPFTASVSAASGTAVTGVSFYVNGVLVGSDNQAPYATTWTPSAAGSYVLTATATNNASITATSAPVTAVVSSNSAPSVVLTSPSAGTSVGAGTAVNLAATASDTDGSIVSVRYIANGFVVASATTSPFLATWTPSAAGSYSIVAQATDNSGNVSVSSAVTLTVTGNTAPSVSVTSPRTGSTLAVSAATTITASAADSDGTIASVQFYANNVSLGTDTVAPYSVSWTPTAEGTYRITAVAIDNSGASTTSSTVVVLGAVAGSGTIDTVVSGLYIDAKNFSSGEFTAINLHNRSTTFIAYVPASATLTAAKTYYFANIPTDGSGNFELTNSAGVVVISGKFSASGVSGSFKDGTNDINFTGANTASTGSASVGFYNGSVTGHYGSLLTGIVGLDGRITVYAQDGTLTDAGSSTLDSSGGFTLTTRSGNRFVGTADPVTGLLTGTVRKSGTTATDGFTGAQASGSTFSDGSLRNISTRVSVGTGDKILIAGFVVNGASPKTVLLRAIGPTLTANGVSGALANPNLFLFNQSGLQIATNDNWSTGGTAVSAAAATVGAFPLQAGTLDSSLVITLQPGVYSAQVSGVGGTTGVALLELYDVDSVVSYAAEKMVNISTRGQVGTGDNIMIAGFVVNGTAPKKVLVRGVGPTLTAAGVSGALADPILRIVRQNGTLVRENDNWSVGNDVNLVADAAVKIGAFPLAEGSKDAVILMNLMPGVYSAQLSGASGGTGIGLIEVYEVQ